jgi:hypothetical protein
MRVALVLLLCVVHIVSSQSVSYGDEADEFFLTRIEPILKEHCYECHSHANKMRGGLTLDSKTGWEQGGDSGPAVVVGRPDESLMILAVRREAGLEMPPKEKLSSNEIALLEEWVKRGAHDPRVLEAHRPSSKDWWSLKPLVSPEVPKLMSDNAAGTTLDVPLHPIDAFIQEKLRERKLEPSPAADRRTLIRRLYYDLHGLPPTMADVNAFVNDLDSQAYERLVDKLLESPRYGERWARHWLDTIHFAETHGCGHDLPRDHAWPFRDYVIDAFNSDKPWPRFIREQLAADHFFPDQSQLTPALGFLGAGVFDHSAYQTAPINFDYLDRDDLVTQTMGAFASTTANCARCHAHKFDPITQEDYYSLQAVFAGIIEGNVPFDEDASIGRERRHWKSMLASLNDAEQAKRLSIENRELVNEWERRFANQARWHLLEAETYSSLNGATLARDGEILVSSDTKPDKDTYLITARVPLTKISALRLDAIADPSLPMGGPGRQDNGNLTITELDAKLFEPGTPQAKTIAFTSASADFEQSGWTAMMAIDHNETTGWGIHPSIGVSHHLVVGLTGPMDVPKETRIAIAIKQTSGKSHLIGRFKLSVTDGPVDSAVAIPSAVTQALAIPAASRSEAQAVAIASHALRSIATDKLAKLPPPSRVYAAAKQADVLLNVGVGTPTQVAVPKMVQILKRGEFDKPIGAVTSGALSAVDVIDSRFPQADLGNESQRRAALADWLADDHNPLTWRSIANRVWHYHFGRGICDSPNDFGRMGGVPSHPELLDWLACRLKESGGSLKHLHRLIVTSRTYQQSSQFREAPATLDGDNRLLWRMNRLRLDADGYRDYVLSVTDRLELKMGGPSDRQFVTGPPVQLTPTLNYAAFEWSSQPKHRRSIYRFVWRGVPDPFMDTIDFPDLGMAAPVRGFSASALQSLALFNNAFVLHFSNELAQQLKTPREAVQRVFLREPTDAEAEAFAQYTDRYGLAALCRLLFNSNEFLFVN